MNAVDSAAVPGFQVFQRDFGRYLRAPRPGMPPGGLPAARARVYRELLFNNLRGFIDACFPISRALLGERRWARLLRRFFADWRSQTPMFTDISRDFVSWLATAEKSEALPVRLPAYLIELAHYEWAELAVDIMPTAVASEICSGDLMQGRPVVAPAHMLLAYRWPVHRIGLSFRPRKPAASTVQLIVFRDRDDTVQFAEINSLTARLLALLAEGRMSGLAACRQVAGELHHPQPEVVIAGGAAMLAELFNWGVIYGIHA